MTVWLNFGASIIGGVVVAIAALGGIWLGQKGDDKRANIADKQHLRDIKAERLRSLYEPIVGFSQILYQIAFEQNFIFFGETEDERDKRHLELYIKAGEKLNETFPAIKVEPGTNKILEAHEIAFKAYRTYLQSWNITKQNNSISNDEFKKQFEDLEGSLNKLQKLVLEQLEELEKPVGSSKPEGLYGS